MSAKKSKSTPTPTAIPASDMPKTKAAAAHTHNFKLGLGVYIAHPETNPGGIVIEYDDDFVLIRDKFPKASVHLLLIPRDPTLTFENPLTALSQNPAFLEKCRTRAARAKRLAASELRRKYGTYSASDAPYQTALAEAMSSPDAPASPSDIADLPAGRDWESEIKMGVHTHPSMEHMHIHILSREMHSECVKHKKHYLSMHSSFFVGMDEFPLEEGSGRFRPGKWPDWDMVCWRCGRNFANKFAALKRHLEEEFEAWKKE